MKIKILSVAIPVFLFSMASCVKGKTLKDNESSQSKGILDFFSPKNTVQQSPFVAIWFADTAPLGWPRRIQIIVLKDGTFQIKNHAQEKKLDIKGTWKKVDEENIILTSERNDEFQKEFMLKATLDNESALSLKATFDVYDRTNASESWQHFGRLSLANRHAASNDDFGKCVKTHINEIEMVGHCDFFLIKIKKKNKDRFKSIESRIFLRPGNQCVVLKESSLAPSELNTMSGIQLWGWSSNSGKFMPVMVPKGAVEGAFFPDPVPIISCDPHNVSHLKLAIEG